MKYDRIGETSSDEGRKLYFSGRKNTRHQDAGFKDTVNTAIIYKPVSSRFITLRLRENPFSTTIVNYQVKSENFTYVLILLTLKFFG